MGGRDITKCTTAHWPPTIMTIPNLTLYGYDPWCSIKNDPQGKPLYWDYCQDKCYGEVRNFKTYDRQLLFYF